MKKILIVLMVMLSPCIMNPSGHAQSLDDAFEQFSLQFQTMKPPPGSSINTDYKLEQSAFAGYYAARMLTLIGKQNQELLSRYDEMLRKYDLLLKQNERIIQLLSHVEPPGSPR